jgi:hypothetical protein
MRLNRFHLPAVLYALILCLATGCAGPSPAQIAAQSQSHLDAQDNQLTSASQHLAAAATRLAAEPDPRRAGDELAAGAAQVRQASQSNQAIRADVQTLGDQAVALQKQIDSHQNDLLGPRGKRIRNYLILAGVLIAVGAILLRVGPLLGGPVGGAILLTGHLLTAFAWPVLQAIVSYAGGIWSWVIAKLSALGGSSTANPNTPAAAPVVSAASAKPVGGTPAPAGAA